MELNYLKQEPGKPLFPDLLWSRPENKLHAGKLLIIGGSQGSFHDVAEAYSEALKAGAGSVRVIMPSSLEKTVGPLFPEADFAPSNASGSFAGSALADLMDASEWADGVLLAGDFSKNSETNILLENYIGKYTGQLILTGDSLDLPINPSTLLPRLNTLLIPTLGQAQKIAAKQGVAITSQLELIQLVQKTRELLKILPLNLVLATKNQYIVAADGKISITAASTEVRLHNLASRAAVWCVQNPGKIFEAVNCAVIA